MGIAGLIRISLPLSVGLTVFAFGLIVRREDGWYLRRHPAQLARSILALHLITPAIALALALAFDLDPAVEIALIALAVSPVSPFIPWMEMKAGGRESYLAALLFGTALLAVGMVPLLLHLVGLAFPGPATVPTGLVLNTVLSTIRARS